MEGYSRTGMLRPGLVEPKQHLFERQETCTRWKRFVNGSGSDLERKKGRELVELDKAHLITITISPRDIYM